MTEQKHSFIPAKPTSWFISAAQTLIRADLALTNKLVLNENEFEVFRALPPGAGIILASNHADEADPLVCLELARRSGMRLITMCNREAFDENFGVAGWALQRLGYFSVKRGAHDSDAKKYAIDVVRSGRDALLIFPEGEIFYLNEEIQPFHSGAIDIGMQAIVENRKSQPDWNAYIVPMVIKYHYDQPVLSTIEIRVAKMEAELSLSANGATLPNRIAAVQKSLFLREAAVHRLKTKDPAFQQMTQDIVNLEKSIVSEVEQRHRQASVSEKAAVIDQAWQLAAQIKESLTEENDPVLRNQAMQDLNLLKEAEQLSSWRPHYYLELTSPDRLAEVVMKLERQMYKIKRPRQLANRTVYVKIAEPVSMEAHLIDYVQDPRQVRHNVTKQLHERIQTMVSALAKDSGGNSER
ncbi:MAG TPA: 1-acyl-sn-glycerol-3-phosphate acyltransferase [Planktothrix sp.]|jgi:hypothetical protein